MMEVIAVCISEKKGERKHPVPEITLRCGHGIEIGRASCRERV